MAMSVNKGHNVQPFTGNDDVSIWVKNYRVARETQNKSLIYIIHFPRNLKKSRHYIKKPSKLDI